MSLLMITLFLSDQCACVRVQSVWLLVTPPTVVCQAPLPMEFFSGENTRLGCHVLLQGIFLTQGSNSGFLHWQADSLLLCYLGSQTRAPPLWTHLTLMSSIKAPSPNTITLEARALTQAFWRNTVQTSALIPLPPPPAPVCSHRFTYSASNLKATQLSINTKMDKKKKKNVYWYIGSILGIFLIKL